MPEGRSGVHTEWPESECLQEFRNFKGGCDFFAYAGLSLPGGDGLVLRGRGGALPGSKGQSAAPMHGLCNSLWYTHALWRLSQRGRQQRTLGCLGSCCAKLNTIPAGLGLPPAPCAALPSAPVWLTSSAPGSAGSAWGGHLYHGVLGDGEEALARAGADVLAAREGAEGGEDAHAGTQVEAGQA